MSKPPKVSSSEFKLKLVLESFKGDRAITDLAAPHGRHPKQIHRWRNQLLEEGEGIF